MTPYYSESGITLYHAKMEEVVLRLPEKHFAVLVMDPPYTFRLESLQQFNDCLIENKVHVLLPLRMTHADFGHPHVRDFEEMCELIEPTSGPILDPYMGSGTTLVAAKKLGRECVGIEMCEKYCQAAVERLEAVESWMPINMTRVI